MHIGHGYLGGNAFSLAKLTVTVATLFTAAPLVLAPTQASAFDVRGLVAMAAAHYGVGGYRGGIGGGSRARTHLASRHSHHSDDNDAESGPPAERLPPSRQEISGPPPRLDGERFKPALASSRTYTEEPVFAPSR